MTRVVFACIVIVVVMLSAALTSVAAPNATISPIRPAADARPGALMRGDANINLLGSPRTMAQPAQRAEEGPAPAVLAYLALVIVGSGLAINSVRVDRQREE